MSIEEQLKYEVTQLQAQLRSVTFELLDEKQRHDVVISKYNMVMEECDKANAELKTLTAAVFDWCKDCELQSDCIAPDLKPCTLKPAYKIAITAKLKEG